MTATLSPAPTVALPRFDDAAAWVAGLETS